MPSSVASLIRSRSGDAGLALRCADGSGPDETWPEFTGDCVQRAALLVHERGPGPFHVGVLADNVAEFAHWLGATALAGATLVGINPTRRGAELARDITHTACQIVVVEPAYLELLDGGDLGIGPDRVWVTNAPDYRARVAAHAGADLTTLDEDMARLGLEVTAEDLYLLVFTSGTSGAPKAVKCSQGRLARIAEKVAAGFGLGAHDVCYVAMPLFHSNALMAGWAPALAAGATTVLRRRFSASAFLPDVRRFGVTYANYVGKPLAYVLATDEQADDAENPLRIAFGNEASDGDISRFAERFGCAVIDGYGSTEGGANVSRTADTPPGALGPAGPGDMVLNRDTGEECATARFDPGGALINDDDAVGELVNRHGGAQFEGYWDNDEAEADRLRNGWYWTGDLVYRDADGFLYFAGRSSDWMRVDGENLATAPVERILLRHPGVAMAAVYAVPDPVVGDQCMAAVVLRPGATFEPRGFGEFLADQPDLGTKAAPRFLRVIAELPTTQTNKVLKRQLQAEATEVDDPVWRRPGRDLRYEPLTP